MYLLLSKTGVLVMIWGCLEVIYLQNMLTLKTLCERKSIFFTAEACDSFSCRIIGATIIFIKIIIQSTAQ